MTDDEFNEAFKALTDYPPFPWQRALYKRFVQGDFPDSCNLPTGLGKTSVVAVWLIALATAPPGVKIPRRLVYVVNRRTVVDQTTTEVEKLRENLSKVYEVEDRLIRMCAALPATVVPFKQTPPLAISTLRGQFADNREWSADPARPAVVVGTVDMIGSRLLFGGYGVGFKGKPLHAGFLGQDALLVHDEAHLEPAFQRLAVAIQKEQDGGERTGELPWPKLRVIELSATPRGEGRVFPNPGERAENEKDPVVAKRVGAKKAIHLHPADDPKNPADQLTKLAAEYAGKGPAVLVFARTVDTVDKVADKLRKAKLKVETLTGTMRGLERNNLIKKPVFQRFLPESNRDAGVTPEPGTVYLVCTSAGEVGVNISADHLVCDLSPFDSMAQRFGRVNRFGRNDDTRIDIIHPTKFDESDDSEKRLKLTLELLAKLNGDGSPAALGQIHRKAMGEGSETGPMSADQTKALREYILSTYSPQPTILDTSDILFDAWALTTVRGKLPGRPKVEPYLHGVGGWEPPETHVAWRREVSELDPKDADEKERAERRKLLPKLAAELLEDYPLKPHELLRNPTYRVVKELAKLAASAETPAWVVTDEGEVSVTTLGDLWDADKELLAGRTLLLPPEAGGMKFNDEGKPSGLLDGSAAFVPEHREKKDGYDVADELKDVDGQQRRVRVWYEGNQRKLDEATKGMRLVRRIEFPAGDEDDVGKEWCWFESLKGGDTDGSKGNKFPVKLDVHTRDVFENVERIVAALPLSEEMRAAVILAAKWHDLGKERQVFQKVLGNWKVEPPLLAKSGKKAGRRGLQEVYRHEFGSLVDVLDKGKPHHGEFEKLSEDMRDVVLHLIATHHGRGRPHFPPDEATHPANGKGADDVAREVPRRFARLQRTYGRWGLAYLESLLRAADYAASAAPSEFYEEKEAQP